MFQSSSFKASYETEFEKELYDLLLYSLSSDLMTFVSLSFTTPHDDKLSQRYNANSDCGFLEGKKAPRIKVAVNTLGVSKRVANLHRKREISYSVSLRVNRHITASALRHSKHHLPSSVFHYRINV